MRFLSDACTHRAAVSDQVLRKWREANREEKYLGAEAVEIVV